MSIVRTPLSEIQGNKDLPFDPFGTSLSDNRIFLVIKQYEMVCRDLRSSSNVSDPMFSCFALFALLVATFTYHAVLTYSTLISFGVSCAKIIFIVRRAYEESIGSPTRHTPIESIVQKCYARKF